jgi:hypothetical protein
MPGNAKRRRRLAVDSCVALLAIAALVGGYSLAFRARQTAGVQVSDSTTQQVEAGRRGPRVPALRVDHAGPPTPGDAQAVIRDEKYNDVNLPNGRVCQSTQAIESFVRVPPIAGWRGHAWMAFADLAKPTKPATPERCVSLIIASRRSKPRVADARTAALMSYACCQAIRRIRGATLPRALCASRPEAVSLDLDWNPESRRR